MVHVGEDQEEMGNTPELTKAQITRERLVMDRGLRGRENKSPMEKRVGEAAKGIGVDAVTASNKIAISTVSCVITGLCRKAVKRANKLVDLSGCRPRVGEDQA
jgi:hypothetical protein